MSTDLVVAEAAADYSGPYFGTHIDHMVRMTAMDGFIAGVEWLVGHPAEFERLRSEWATGHKETNQ